jgi:hypothetical protein
MRRLGRRRQRWLWATISYWDASDARSACPRAGGKSWPIRFLSNWIWGGRTQWNVRWRKKGLGNVANLMQTRVFWRLRVSRATVVKIRREWSHRESDARWFSEQRNQDDRRDNRGLRSDGNDQSTAANAAFAFTLLGAAFDETPLQGTEIILRTGAGFDRHHTPPQKNAASENRNFCDAGLLGVAQLPQETGAALAGM